MKGNNVTAARKAAQVTLIIVLCAVGVACFLLMPPERNRPGAMRWTPSDAALPDARSRFSLLLGGSEFWTSVRRDLASARQCVYVQTLSFEGDAAGEALTDALVSCPASDRRLAIDYFSRTTLSDRSLYSPRAWWDPELKAEARKTDAAVERCRLSGARVQYLFKPDGRFWKWPLRNHKKLVVLDGKVAYVGGINFSEHNFAWDDFMIRINDPKAALFLERDFKATWDGGQLTDSLKLQSLELFVAPGGSSLTEVVRGRISAATKEIVLLCPYVTEPFFEMLGEACRRGVRVVVATPETNNRLFMKGGIQEGCRRRGLELRLIPGGMRHEKALWIDGKTLITGSANFDYLSYGLQPEVVAVISDEKLVLDFERRCLGPLRARWKTVIPPGGMVASMERYLVELAGWILRAL